jgi:hypothetical protein
MAETITPKNAKAQETRRDPARVATADTFSIVRRPMLAGSPQAISMVPSDTSKPRT